MNVSIANSLGIKAISRGSARLANPDGSELWWGASKPWLKEPKASEGALKGWEGAGALAKPSPPLFFL